MGGGSREVRGRGGHETREEMRMGTRALSGFVVGALWDRKMNKVTKAQLAQSLTSNEGGVHNVQLQEALAVPPPQTRAIA